MRLTSNVQEKLSELILAISEDVDSIKNVGQPLVSTFRDIAVSQDIISPIPDVGFVSIRWNCPDQLTTSRLISVNGDLIKPGLNRSFTQGS